MKNVASKNDHEATLAWLDDSLEWARPENRTRLVNLLNLVRTEILFDMDFSEGPRAVRNLASREDPTPNSNRCT